MGECQLTQHACVGFVVFYLLVLIYPFSLTKPTSSLLYFNSLP